MDAVNASAKFEVRSFTRSWDNSDEVLGGVVNPQSKLGCGLLSVVVINK